MSGCAPRWRPVIAGTTGFLVAGQFAHNSELLAALRNAAQAWPEATLIYQPKAHDGCAPANAPRKLWIEHRQHLVLGDETTAPARRGPDDRLHLRLADPRQGVPPGAPRAASPSS